MVLREIRRLWSGYPRETEMPEVADWLAALHDLGKVTAAFQDKIYRAIGPSPWPESPNTGNPDEANHAKFSQILLKNEFGRVFAGMAGSHHGADQKLGLGDTEENEALGGPEWVPLRETLIRELKQTLDLPDCDFKNIPRDKIDVIVGAVILADWIRFTIRLPHTRGGVSNCTVRFHKGFASSPRLWGCFSGIPARYRDEAVFPTPVGVFLE